MKGGLGRHERQGAVFQGKGWDVGFVHCYALGYGVRDICTRDEAKPR